MFAPAPVHAVVVCLLQDMATLSVCLCFQHMCVRVRCLCSVVLLRPESGRLLPFGWMQLLPFD